MQLSEFTFIFLTLCIPFLYYIVQSTGPKKGFSILFVGIISLNTLLKPDNFSFLGLFFLILYLYSYEKIESKYYLALSFFSFSSLIFSDLGIKNLNSIVPILLISSIFSLMMIGHWFLVDPTISRVGMKNIAKSSMFFATMLCLLLITGLITNDISTLYRNIILGLYISSGILSLGAYKSLNETSYTGVMAATGLSYLSLLVSLGGTGTLILLP